MDALTELQSCYFFLKLGLSSHQVCIDWAVERLQSNQHDDDLDVVLLAGAITYDEVLPLVGTILERHLGLASFDSELAGGKYIVSLYQSYQEGKETAFSLDQKFTKLNYSLGSPDWLVMLGRNCEYAIDIPNFSKPFEDEFEYIANLWADVESRNEFQSRYSRDISNQQDISYC